MRNLKKILALVLALVMSLSLVTIANAADFTDNDEISYEEAADVMNAIGIIEGFEDGSFDPDGTLTREQAATLVTRMLLGDNADRLGVESSTFDDVAVTRWSAPYIEYCASLGLIDGAGDGNFYPAATLTGYEFAKILLTAIGYDSDAEGLVGTSWSVNTAALAMSVGLDDGMENGISSAYLTREEAAQMALNAICTPLVAYDDGVTVVVDGTPVSVGSGDAYYVTTTLAREQRISEARLSNTNEYTVEFGERYFPDLRLVDDPDEFMRPCHTWVFENEEIGSYVDYDLLQETYTTAVTGADLYNLIGRTTINSYDIAYYVDGALEEDVIAASNMIRTNTRDYSTTGNGVLTQVFVDHSANDGDGAITITSINTYLAQATADYNESRGTLSLDVFQGGTDYTMVANGYTVSDVDFPNIVDYQEDDYMLVNLALANDNNQYEIVRINDVDVMSDSTITRYSRDNYLVTGGEQYDYAEQGYNHSGVVGANAVNDLGAYNNDLLANYTYNVYLDQYGYVIGVEEYAGQANYLFLTGYDMNTSNLGVTTATGGAIFLDGTFTRIQIDLDDTNENITYDANSNGTIDPSEVGTAVTGYSFISTTNAGTHVGSQYNRWFTYTTSVSGGDTIYTLSPVDNWLDVDAPTSTANVFSINSSRVFLSGSYGENQITGITNRDVAYGNDDSVYITAEIGDVSAEQGAPDRGITKTTGVFTGVQDVDLTLAVGGAGQENDLDATTSNSGSSRKGIFAVYDDNQYVIAAIVIGEDTNNTDRYAYVLGGARSETYEDGYYYWDFYAVVEGQIQLLTVKTEYTSVINRIANVADISATYGSAVSGLVTLTYDADGYVVDATTYGIDSSTTDAIYGNADWGATPPNNALNTNHHDAYNVYFNDPSAISLTDGGRTLYFEGSTSDVGLALASGAPVIVVQEELGTNESKGQGDVVYESYDNLRQALSVLANDGSPFRGWASAVLNDNGTAQYIVLKSENPVGIETDDGSTPTGGDFDINSLTFSNSGIIVNITNNTGVALPSTSMNIVVRNAAGNQVYAGAGTATAGGSVAPTATQNVTFGGYTAVPSTSGNYTVTITVTVGGVSYSSTAVIGTI